MDTTNLKNIVVLKNLPSNIVEEAIVVLKRNKKLHKLQMAEVKENRIDSENKKENNEYIVKEAEMLVKKYTDELEKQSPKWRRNMKKLEKRYKFSVRINFLLLFTTVLGIIFNLIWIKDTLPSYKCKK